MFILFYLKYFSLKNRKKTVFNFANIQKLQKREHRKFLTNVNRTKTLFRPIQKQSPQVTTQTTQNVFLYFKKSSERNNLLPSV